MAWLGTTARAGGDVSLRWWAGHLTRDGRLSWWIAKRDGLMRACLLLLLLLLLLLRGGDGAGGACSHWCSSPWLGLFDGFEDLVVEKIKCGAEDYPLDTIFVAFSQCLPYRLLLGGLSRDRDSRATATRTRGVLLDLAKFDTLGGNEVARVGKVEHAPERGVRVGFGDLEEGEIGGVWGGQGELVDRGHDARVGDGPFEIARCLATDYAS